LKNAKNLLKNQNFLLRKSLISRIDAEQKTAKAKSDIEIKKAEIKKLKTQSAELERQISNEKDESSREVFRQKLAEWKRLIEEIGEDISQAEAVLSNQKRAFQNQINKISSRHKEIKKAIRELERKGEYEELERLEQERILLNDERERLEGKISELVEVKIAPPTDNLSNQISQYEKEIAETQSKTAEILNESAGKVIENLENGLNNTISIFNQDVSSIRHIASLEQINQVKYAETPSPRDSSLKLMLSVKCKFLGLNLELLDLNFQLYDLPNQNWNNKQLFKELPERVLHEISRNILGLISKTLKNFKEIFWHLVKFVFDPDFRQKCLNDTNFDEQMLLDSDEVTDEIDIKANKEAENKLILAGWSKEELDKLK
jgi:hypothetical protein